MEVTDKRGQVPPRRNPTPQPPRPKTKLEGNNEHARIE